MKLREIAYSRSGDKGDVSNVCVFPYDDADWPLLVDKLTVEAVRQRFGTLVTGDVTRYEVPSLKGLNFVMTGALAGGVSISLRTDPHGKSYGSLILDIEIGHRTGGKKMNDDELQPGEPMRRRAQGAKADRLQEALATLDPQHVIWADSFVFGEVWGRPGISHDERMLVAITALAAGKNTEQLKNYLHGALEAGIPAKKLHEALMMLVVYCGFPVALSAMSCWRDVVAAARRRGMEIDLEMP